MEQWNKLGEYWLNGKKFVKNSKYNIYYAINLDVDIVQGKISKF